MTAVAFRYPDEVEALREELAVFVRQEVIARHEAHASLLDNPRRLYAEDGRFVPDAVELIRGVRMASARAGYYAMSAPESLGGADMGLVAYFGAWERIAHLCGSRYWLGDFAIAHWATGPSRVVEEMTPRARQEILPGLMSGERSLCFALSEPGAGSDATMITTRAVADGDGWRLNGAKIWTTHSPIADHAIVFAVTDPERSKAKRGGISAFLVPTAAPGFQIAQIVRMWGSVGGDEAVLHFDDVRLEPHQLVGRPHDGFRIAMLGVNLGRVYNSGRAVGMSRWALERAFDYVKVRKAFGNTLSEYQGVTFPLADCATQVHAAHLMALNAAQLLDAGAPARKELAMAKGFAVQTAARTFDAVMQAHGAIGMTNEMRLTSGYVIARLLNIADGSNEILRRTIVKQMLDGDLDL